MSTVQATKSFAGDPNLLPRFGPLQIESIEEYLKKSKVKFKTAYNETIQNFSIESTFDLLCVLSEGGFSKVLIVRNQKDRQIYAMKVMRKKDLVRKKQVEHTLNEKRILQSVDFPFGVRMEYFSNDNCNIYFIMPFVSGGDLFTHLRKADKFEESRARFYAAQVVLGLEYMHAMRLVYRDLKPENLIIDHYGFLKISDFGFAKIVKERTYTLCGTAQYFAPEAILGQGYGPSVDWWGLGVLIYEMNAGYEPFNSKDQFKIFAKIVKGRYTMPDYFGKDLKDVVEHLLKIDVSQRYGCMRNGVQDVKNHAWFKVVNWLLLFNRKTEPPYVPEPSELHNLTNFPLAQNISAFKKENCDDDNLEVFKEF